MIETPSYLLHLSSFSQLSGALFTAKGQIEFLLSIGIFVGSYLLLRSIAKNQSFYSGKIGKYQSFWKHIKYRLAWPVGLTIALLIASIVWHELAQDNQVVWLTFFIRAAIWLGVIRIIMAITRYAIPNNFFDAAVENLLSIVLWVCFILWLSGLDEKILNWMASIRFPIGKSQITLLSILSAFFWVGIILVFAMWLARVLEVRIMQFKRIDINARIVINKLISIGLIIMAILIALPMVGIDLTVLSVFGGALGVGLGFGLQKIASSYVSGFIILLERSLRLGDMVIINGSKGIVDKITSRYVVLKAADGSDHLIPNDSIISNTVTNLSLSDNSMIWAQVDVQVAYNTDLDFAMALLKQAAVHERIAAEPAPTPYLISFGDFGVNMAIAFWVNESEKGLLGLKSTVSMNIWHLFKENAIEIPFPQQEIRILGQHQNNH